MSLDGYEVGQGASPTALKLQSLSVYASISIHIAGDYRINTQFITHLSDNNNTSPHPPRDLYKPQTTKSSQNTENMDSSMQHNSRATTF